MPFNGSGVFSIVNTFVPGTTIFSSAVNANFTDIATGLSSCMLKDGTQTITATIPMAGFGFTGVGSIGSQAVITVASATTCDILSQSSLLIAISGVATITGFGADAASRRNQIKFVRATGAFLLTHNGTSLILPTGANITAASGDTFVVISDASSNARVYAYQRASGFPVISYPGFRNIVRRNGGLETWQRGAGGAASIAQAASLTGYGPDGWYLVTAADQASVMSQQAGLVDGSQFCARVQRNSGQTGTGGMTFGFPIDTDELYTMLGQFVRLSLTLRAGANWSPASGNIVIAINVGTGTPVKFSAGYTGAAVAATLTQAITTSSVRYQLATAAVIPTTTRQAEITLTWTPVGTAGTNDYFEIDDVQLEVIPDASQGSSPFERLNFEEQMELCRRHFNKTFVYSTAPAQNVGVNTGELTWMAGNVAAAGTRGVWRFSPPMRITPTMTLYNPAAASAEARNETGTANCTSTATGNLSSKEVVISSILDGGATSGQLIGLHLRADAGI